MRSLFRKRSTLSIDTLEREAMWGKMRYKLGTNFMGLDSAGNPCFYYSYKKNRAGGWGPLTISDLHTPDPTQAGGFALLVNRHPLHVKCVPLLEKYLGSLREQQAAADKEWTEVLKKRHAEIIEGFEKEETATSSGAATEKTSSTSESSSLPQQPEPICLKSAMRKALYNKRICRVSRLRTFAYKSLYFTILGISVMFGVLIYKRFKAWLNPPARQGLTNIENSILFYPKQILEFLTANVFIHVLGVLDAVIDFVDGTELGSQFIDVVFRIFSSFDTESSDNEYYASLDRAKKSQTKLQRNQSSRLRELFGFLFLLLFVLLIL